VILLTNFINLACWSFIDNCFWYTAVTNYINSYNIINDVCICLHLFKPRLWIHVGYSMYNAIQFTLGNPMPTLSLKVNLTLILTY